MYAKLWVALSWSCKYTAMRILYDDNPTLLSRAWGKFLYGSGRKCPSFSQSTYSVSKRLPLMSLTMQSTQRCLWSGPS
jgi:hypothetical protein